MCHWFLGHFVKADFSVASVFAIEDNPQDEDSTPLPDEHLRSHDFALQRSTETILGLQSICCASARFGQAPEHTSCPSGNKSTKRTHAQTSTRETTLPSKRTNLGVGRKGSTDRANEPNSDDEKPHKQQTRRTRRNEDPNARQYACPFLKHNPHRHRHFESCRRGYWQLSELKWHLVRPNSPHEFLHECRNCNQMFPEQSALEAHSLNENQCESRAIEYPVEGIGERLRALIKESIVSRSQGKAWWDRIFRLLFGEDVEVPLCYYDERDIINSNDLGRQEHYRDRLIETWRRVSLTEAIKEKFMNYHLFSCLEAEAEHLTTLGAHANCPSVHDMVARSMDAVRGRRRSCSFGTRAGDLALPSGDGILPGQEGSSRPSGSAISAPIHPGHEENPMPVEESEHIHPPSHIAIDDASMNIPPDMDTTVSFTDFNGLGPFEFPIYYDDTVFSSIGNHNNNDFTSILDQNMSDPFIPNTDRNIVMVPMPIDDPSETFFTPALPTWTNPTFDSLEMGAFGSDVPPKRQSMTREELRYQAADQFTVGLDQAAHQPLASYSTGHLPSMDMQAYNFFEAQSLEFAGFLESVGNDARPMNEVELDRHIDGNSHS
ncbi:hypothetical protein CC80DRAFT_543464 [Byssothecium circinans]|uniref:C2H2-type domain-containing protein n=1 Tax=Byssothecium circinans TaxID=147558 RepID=A0A6A5UBA8_9PLEO|nr:hypothetical protein CC80DRAFT_543464 [Byssothecium circinans]